MMLQDWTTISGVDTVITQSRRGWADLLRASNVTFWVEVRSVLTDGAQVTLVYESAPADEEQLFRPIGSVPLAATTSGIVTRVRLADDPNNALGRFVRWSVGGMGHWTVTFRVHFTTTTDLEGPRGMSGDTSGFRLTLTSGVPVSTGNFSQTLYFSPFTHNQIVLYDGAKWNTYKSNEISITNNGLLVDELYDVFAFLNTDAQQVALEFSAAWTTRLTRFDTVIRKDGLFVKAANPTRRLVGTVRHQLGDANGFVDEELRRFVWNADNRVDRPLLCMPIASSWTYSGAAWRAANGGASYSVCSYVDGAGEDLVSALVIGRATSSNSSLQIGLVGIGLDTETANVAQIRGADAVRATDARSPRERTTVDIQESGCMTSTASKSRTARSTSSSMARLVSTISTAFLEGSKGSSTALRRRVQGWALHA